VELRLGKIFGVRRKIGSGCDLTRDGGDLDHPRLHVECKERQSFQVIDWYLNAEQLAAREYICEFRNARTGACIEHRLGCPTKTPILVIYKKGLNRFFLVVPLGADILGVVERELRSARSQDQKETTDGSEE
jgi:hypothetical protein